MLIVNPSINRYDHRMIITTQRTPIDDHVMIIKNKPLFHHEHSMIIANEPRGFDEQTMIIINTPPTERRQPMIETEQATAKEATKRLNTLIPLSLHQNLKAHAQKKGRCHTLTSVITEVLTTYLKQPFDENGNPIVTPHFYPRIG